MGNQFHGPALETLYNQKKTIFSGLSQFSGLLLDSNVLLPPAAIKVEFINFSGPKRSFGLRDRADCKQRETKCMRCRIGAWENPAAVTGYIIYYDTVRVLYVLIDYDILY